MESRNRDTAPRSSVFDALAEVVKAIANGRRLELIELLAQGERSVESLSRVSGMGMTTTSSHLRTLRQAGLVRTRRERTTVYYRLAGDDVAELFLAAKRAGLRHYPELRETLLAYLGAPAPGSTVESIDPSAVTSGMTVIDVRPRSEFQAGHFPGALSIPFTELAERLSEIPDGVEVVVYCRGEFCRMARESAQWLREQGVRARAMDEGVVEWRATKDVDLDIA